MSYIKEYLFVLVVIIFCINVSWSADIPKIVKLKRLVSKQNRLHRVLQCVARGNPVPTVSWTFNGQNIEDNDHYDLKNDNSVLTVNDVSSNDTGNYRCYATNTYGMIFAQLHLTIVGIGVFKDGYTPDVISPIRNVTIGKPVELKCPPHTDIPGQLYTWAIPPFDFLYPGKPLVNVFISDNHGALYFSHITADDVTFINLKGGISCLLYEDFTNMVPSVKILLRSDGKESTEDLAPKVVVFMGNETVGVEGGKKKLLCGATGKPHPIFKWYKDGKLISTDDASTSTVKNIYFEGKGLILRIINIRKDDAGLYRCVASNPAGTDSKEANFIVHSKVAWTKQLPEKYNVPVKKPITLECVTKGFPEPKYIWYHNDTIIGNSLLRTIKGGTMNIPVTDFGDSGMYLCTAGNYLNTIVSPVYVTIEDVAPVFLKELSGVYYILYGSHYDLTCDATGGPEPTIKWYQNDILITNNEHFTVKPDGRTLVFEIVTKDQNGVYKCVAENRKDKVESTGVVKVFVKTLITKHPDNVRYAAGYSAYLFCDATVDKTLKATWQWLKDGKVIEYDDHIYLKDQDRTDKKISSHTLKVKGIIPEDAGEYTCKVFTVDDATFRSEDSASGTITVIAAPLVVGNLKIIGTFDKDKKTDSKKPGEGDKKTDPTKEPLSDGEVTLSWNAPNKYVGPADKYIIEYAKANSSDWNQYDPPKKFKSTSVKLDKDKLPADADVVFRIKAVSTYKGEEMVGEPSNATEAGSLVTPTRAPNVQPSNVRLEMEDDGNVTVAWDKLDDVDRPGPGFKVVGAYREIDPNKSEFTNFTKDGDSNSVEGPVASEDGVDKVYEVFIRSKNDEGYGPEKKVILKVPGKTISEKVVNVTLVNVTSKGATIKWTGISGATGYRIYYTKKDSRKRRSTQTYTDVTGNQATISDLKPGSQYEITVAAMNLKGPGPISDPLKVATKNGVPGIPTGVSLDTYADVVRLGWAPPKEPGIKNYTITWYPKDDPSKKKSMTVDGDEQQAFITDKSLDPQTYYTVEVVATSDEGKGRPWVMEGVVIGEADAPGKPARPIADPINETMINVTFKLPTTYYGGLPKTFKICYRKDKCFTSKYPDKPYVVVDSLDYTVTYEFWSIAENDDGVGEKSDTVKQRPLDPPTTIPPPTTTTSTIAPSTTNETVVEVVLGSAFEDEKEFYEEDWFIILLIILLILIIIAIILCIICNRRGGRYPVGKKEKEYGGWDKDPLKDYSDNAMENGAGMPLMSPTRSTGEDSLKKPPFQDDEEEDSLDDYGEGYGDIGQYGTDTKKEKNGQTVC